MTIRCLVLGGFEPSGHDSSAEALVEAGRALGHAVDYLRWRDIIDLAKHPMFTSHRHAASRAETEIAGLLDEEWIAVALAADLTSYIETGYDAYVSVHPWSSMICAYALAEKAASGLLLDYHCDFGPFPIIAHQRIDAYCGAGRIRALRPSIRSRCHAIGAMAPLRFHDETPLLARSDMLVVSAGSDGWAVQAMLAATRTLIARLKPSQVVLLAPGESARQTWEAASIPQAKIIENCRDISSFLKSARWYLCKGSGVAVAEGLAAGCQTFVSRSGIFWEDEAAELLSAQGIVADANRIDSTPSFNDANVLRASSQCRASAQTIWGLLERGAPPQYRPSEVAMLEELVERLYDQDSDPLPSTTAALRENLQTWIQEWRVIDQ